MPRIYLSPSNQDRNIYAVGNTTECIQCNRIAEAVKNSLERNGFQVMKAPEGQLMNDSINQSNNFGADVHMPIHTNASGSGMAQGTEIFIYDNNALDLGTSLMTNITAITPSHNNRGVKINQELAEVNSTNAMTIYTEVDFHDNVTAARWIIDSVAEIGEAFAKSLCNHFNMNYSPIAPPAPPVDKIEWVWNDSSKVWQVKKNGTPVTGWFKDGNKWYYLDPKTTYMRTGWIQDGGTDWYYLKPDKGEMVTGWFFDDKEKAWYYLHPVNGKMAKGWITVEVKKYYLKPDSSGEMVTGWFFDDKEKSWYYLHPVNGKMAKGWITVEGKKYYLKPDFGGKMARNEYLQTGGMTKYWFNDKGENVE